MKVLFISTDTKLFDKNSSVYERFLGFSNLGEEIHVVVVRPNKFSGIFKISSNIFVYSTSKKSTILSLAKGFLIGFKILSKDRKSDWVISVQDPFEQGIIGFILSKIFKNAFHVQVHTDILSPFFLKNSFLDRLRVLFSGFILRSANRIRVVSLRIKESIIKKYKINESKIDVLQIYIDVPKIIKNQNDNIDYGDYILYVGRFESEKNVESIIRAFSRVSFNLPNLKLLLLGSGSLLSQYKSIAKDLNISDKIVFVPWNNNVASYMRSAKSLVLASYFEGFALVLVEAILNNCPIITTDVGAVGGIIPREYANIFPQDNDLILSEKIIDVVKNQDYQKNTVSFLKENILSKIPQDIDSYTKIFRESLEKSIK